MKIGRFAVDIVFDIESLHRLDVRRALGENSPGRVKVPRKNSLSQGSSSSVSLLPALENKFVVHGRQSGPDPDFRMSRYTVEGSLYPDIPAIMNKCLKFLLTAPCIVGQMIADRTVNFLVLQSSHSDVLTSS
jgi:hypothetical protein